MTFKLNCSHIRVNDKSDSKGDCHFSSATNQQQQQDNCRTINNQLLFSPCTRRRIQSARLHVLRRNRVTSSTLNFDRKKTYQPQYRITQQTAACARAHNVNVNADVTYDCRWPYVK